MEEGFTALASSPPLIYSSVAAPLGVVQHLCKQVYKLIFYMYEKVWTHDHIIYVLLYSSLCHSIV